MSGNADVRTLSGVTLFQDVDPERLIRIEDRCRWHTFSKDEQIIDREDDTQDVYFIVSGLVRVVNYSMSGREIAFEDLRSGAFFGELAALDGERRSANIVSLAVTEVATMSKTAFGEALSENPDVAMRLMQRLAKVIRTSTDRIMDLSTLGANDRVYAELLRLANEGELGDNTAVIKPVPIHGDIASRVSTTRETVARVLSDLSKKGLVTREGSKLNLHDVLLLQEMVEEFRGD